jgi:hypothetical protein
MTENYDLYNESIEPVVKDGFVAEKVLDIHGKFVFWRVKKKLKDCGCNKGQRSRRNINK